MSLYGSKFTIGGVPCGLVLRMGTTGKYRVTFEREYATLEQVEAICWDPPEIEGEGCILPVGYGFEVDRIEYDSNAMLFHVTVHTATQYYGDVSAYEAEVAQLQGTIQEQEGTIAQQTTTISEQAAAIEEKNSTIHQQVSCSTMSADDTITVAALYDEWTEGSYQVGDIRLAWCNGAHQLWKCRQEHDTTTYPDITPDGTAWRTFWIPFHGTTPETAQDWIAPSGAHDQYEAGEYMIWTDGNTYLCKQATVYTPEEYAQAWELYSE